MGAPLELVAEDGRRIPLEGELTIGRAPGSGLLLDDPTISRTHARVVDGKLEDAGSSHGTFLDGQRVSGALPLREGGRVQLGNLQFRVERVAEEDGTIVIGAVTPRDPATDVVNATRVGLRPRLREGVRLKRMPSSEGSRRWLVQDPTSRTFVRVEDEEGALLPRLDGETTLADLVTEAEARMGADGLGKLARLLAELGARGLLAGVEGGTPADEERPPGWRGLLKPRERSVGWLASGAGSLHRRGGFLLLTPVGLAGLALVAVGGFVAAVLLVTERYGTPFVVASHLGLGGLVFIFGRGLIVTVHEGAHALVLGRYGRGVTRAGFRLLVVLPYSFVDTSQSLFEPRRRRMAVTVAGPVSDLVCGGAFALACLALPDGTVRDICFQITFAAYVGALFNLNPFLDRDGYHLIVDRLGEPGLKKRARAALAARLGGAPVERDPVLLKYSVAGIAWMVAAAGLGILMTLRFVPVMEQYADPAIVHLVLATLWAGMFLPVLILVGRPLIGRFRRGEAVA